MALATATAAVAATPAAAVAAPAPQLPAPTYKSVEREVLIPMDDGVKIAATVALPSRDGKTPAAGRFPVVLETTPYSRTGVCGCTSPSFFATRGMVGAVADVRGTGGSGGNLSSNFFSPREARDGYNLVEYFGTRSYSTGKVGMTGGSYVGITQYLAAERRPPHLAVITPQVAISDLYRDGFAHGGIPNLSFDLQYIAVQGGPGTAGANTDPSLLLETLKAKLGQSPPGTIAFDYLERPNDDAFYRDRSPIYNASRIKVPVLDIGEWHDGLLRGETEMYTALARRRGVETRLYMGPCTHKGCGAPLAPLTDPPGQEDTSAVIFEFLAKYLRRARTPARPRVRYYLQHRNRYADSSRWPPTGAGSQRLGLAPGALRPEGTNRSPKGSAKYVVDPAAGFSMSFDQYGTVAASPYVPTDQRLEGPQGLTFRTPVLHSGFNLVGPIALHLQAASTATETDWYAKLADVAPDGSESIITEGALRASHRALDRAKSTALRPYHPHTNPQPIQPNRFYPYDIEIWPTAYQLAPGHRLQLRLTSSDLPTHLPGTYRFNRKDLAGTRVVLNPPATNTVRFRGSWLTLPASQGPSGRLGRGCLARRSPIGPRNVGRVRLGYTRARALGRIPPRPVRKRRWTYAWCVKHSKGRVTAVFSKRSRRGRIRLVADTARAHGMRGVHPGSSVRRLRARFRHRRRLARGLYRGGPRSPRLFGVRRGKVRFVAVADRKLIRSSRALRRELRRAGL